MSEKLSQGHHETHESGETHHTPEHSRSHEAQKETKLEPEEISKAEIDKIRENIDEQSTSKHETKAKSDEQKPQRPTFINKELKNMAYRRTMTRVRKKLRPTERLTSLIVHQPVVNAVSETVGKTVGRPSGIAGGGLLALIGTSTYYFMTKHYGYAYNFSIFLILLVAGFVLGWIAEIFWRTVLRKR